MLLTSHRIGFRLPLFVLALLVIVLALSLVDAQVPTNDDSMKNEFVQPRMHMNFHE